MIIQAKNTAWDKRFAACNTELERNELMLNSGREKAACRIDLRTHQEFYRPAIGKFIIHGMTPKDDFRFETKEEAIGKGRYLRKILIRQCRKLKTA